jgi:hypothetical protein
MSKGPAPLHFLGLVVGGWAAARIALVVPGWIEQSVLAPAAVTTPVIAVADPALLRSLPAPSQPSASSGIALRLAGPVPLLAQRRSKTRAVAIGALPAPFVPIPPELPLRSARPMVASPIPQSPPAGTPPLPDIAPTSFDRWSLSTWAFVRRGVETQLASGGQLGGSQVGARALYRLSERLAVSARLYAPLASSRGAEASLGIEMQPLRTLPVRVLAERRQAIGAAGRPAFALIAHGGISEQPLLGPATVDAYGQAGLVGLQSRDGFVDGSVRFNLPVTGRLSVGAGAWGAAQPGVSRIDLGPQASYRLPIGDGARVSAEWRLRVAGDAQPGSGPALTLATDF